MAELRCQPTSLHDLDAEQYALGAMLFDRKAARAVSQVLRPTDFYHPRHQVIYRAMLKLMEAGQPVDISTLIVMLKDTEGGEAVEAKYICDLYECVVRSGDAEFHAQAVLEKSLARQLVEAWSRIAARAQEGAVTCRNLLDEIESRIREISSRRSVHNIRRAGELAEGVYDELEQVARGRLESGIMTGYFDLDTLISGFHNGNLIILASRPSVGKTSLALNFLDHVAVECRVPVLLFSLEMTATEILQRLICTRAGVSLYRIKARRDKKEDWPGLSRAMIAMSASPIFIDSSASLTIGDLQARAHQIKDREGIGLIIVDYLQLVTGPQSANRQAEVAAVSKALKELARALNVPVLALSQLNRQSERGKEVKPQLVDLRESGALEQDADVVMFIHREKDGSNHYRQATELLVSKQRNGPTGVVELWFKKEITKFELTIRRER